MVRCRPIARLLDVSGETNDSATLRIRWIERGGPEVTTSPAEERTGFGNRLVERNVSRQLGGSIHYDWLPDGVVGTLDIDKGRLST